MAKKTKGFYFLLNVLFILTVGYILAPLPSAKSITRAWLRRLENQLPSEGSSRRASQLEQLNKLMKKGSLEFSSQQQAQLDELLFIFQKQVALDLAQGRLDGVVSVLTRRYFEQIGAQQRAAFCQQSKLGQPVYILSDSQLDSAALSRIAALGKNGRLIKVEKAMLFFEVYALLTSHSGRQFLLSLKKQGEKLELRFSLLTQAQAKKKWEKVRKLLPHNSF